ncbi:expressed unknown protein [Seminavis robusta]|uniref:Uncharacterized protein n=1 Tax=Seminavis robusta TaxID=568900 RepID=A0A9N8HBR7_9STRA|nr:expressed unknown protein [Seminavis robusta]|eukprot:Sro375_g129520.1 n/a (80) ;mRNA; f:55707-56086
MSQSAIAIIAECETKMVLGTGKQQPRDVARKEVSPKIHSGKHRRCLHASTWEENEADYTRLVYFHHNLFGKSDPSISFS